MLDAIFGIGSFLIDGIITIKSAISVVSFARNIWNKFRNNGATPVNTSAEAEKEAKRVQVEIVDLDAEVEELERKFRRDRTESKRDQEKRQELLYLKEQKIKDFENLKSQEAALKTGETPDLYQTINLDNSNSHIIEYHMGVTVLDKKCPRCSRRMVIRSRGQGIELNSVRNLNNFFWGCSGLFCNPQCKYTESIQANDSSILQKNDSLEMQISNQDLQLIFEQPNSQKNVLQRMQEIQYSSNNDDTEILCQVHYVPMVLKEKQSPVQEAGVLDMYYLQCPHLECQQKNKLKSPAQLAAFLKRKTGRGIL